MVNYIKTPQLLMNITFAPLFINLSIRTYWSPQFWKLYKYISFVGGLKSWKWYFFLVEEVKMYVDKWGR